MIESKVRMTLTFPTQEQVKKFKDAILITLDLNEYITTEDIIKSLNIDDLIQEIMWIDKDHCLLIPIDSLEFEEEFELEFGKIRFSKPKWSDRLLNGFLKKYHYQTYPLTNEPRIFKLTPNLIEYDQSDTWNPTIQLSTYQIDTNTISVIRDDLLPGGTKQRGLMPILSALVRQGIDKFVYAGPAQGYAQIALSYCAKALGKKAVIFVARQIPGKKMYLLEKARDYGAEIHYVSPLHASLIQVQYEAKVYVNTNQEKGHKVEYLPFGFDCPAFELSLKEQILKAWPISLIPRRLWVVIGSGLLLKVLGQVFPSTHFMVVKVGKDITNQIWDLFEDRATFFEAPEKFVQDTTILPPYPSISNYDAKLWQFIQQLSQDGDFVWNVAGLSSPTNICKYYQSGTCRFGPSCRNLHL